MNAAVINLGTRRSEARRAADEEAASSAALTHVHRRIVTIAERSADPDEVAAAGLGAMRDLDVLTIDDVGHGSLWRARILVRRHALLEALNAASLGPVQIRGNAP